MQFAIIHLTSLLPIARFDAVDSNEAAMQYVASRPELECDTVNEFATKWPHLHASLSVVPLN